MAHGVIFFALPFRRFGPSTRTRNSGIIETRRACQGFKTDPTAFSSMFNVLLSVEEVELAVNFDNLVGLAQ